MEKNKINKKILTIEDIVAKKEELKKRKEIKKCYVESAFLGGNLEAHSLSKQDMAQWMDIYKENNDKGARYYLWLSIDQLREPELLKAFGRNRGDGSLIISDIFSDGEQIKIGDILNELNGLTTNTETEILMHTVEELQGE